MLKIPYGQSYFKGLIEDGFFYQDRTEYIRMIEDYDSRFLFFLRPRRFGKSLFVSMLHHYYGLEHQSNFQKLFGHLAIGQRPTPLANQMLVLLFEFSRINTDTPESTFQGFYHAVATAVRDFLGNYAVYFDSHQQKEILSQREPSEILRQLFSFHKLNKVPLPIYILIDEYDHFANELISFNFSFFTDSVSKNGFVRKFYETIKTATFDGVVKRLFVTGVSPITLDSLTSGFNISTNLSLDQQFHDMMGFTEAEVSKILQKIVVPETQLTATLNDLRSWYDGYLFNAHAKHLYNPDMVLYFAQKYQIYKTYPDLLLDINIASDYGKIKRLFRIQNREEDNLETLRALSETGEVKAELTAQYSFEKVFSKSDLISLLFYMGFLTIKTKNLSNYTFQFPNYVIEKLYAEYFISMIQDKANLPVDSSPINRAILEMAETGNPQLFFDQVSLILKTLSTRDAVHFHEGSLKAIFISLLHHQQFYYIHSEFETERKYVDVFLEAIKGYKPACEAAFELKYLKKKDSKSIKTAMAEAEIQLKDYLMTKKFVPRETIKGFIVVVKGNVLHWRETKNLNP